MENFKNKKNIDMENKILEELKRINLLSNYDSKLTLSENYTILDEWKIVSEQTQAFLKSGSKQLAKTVAKDIDAIFSSFKGGLRSVDDVVLKNGDDVVKAIKTGKLAPAQLGKVNMGLFRQTQDVGLKTAIARDISSTANFGKTMSSVKTETEAVTALMNGPKKFTKQEAELLVKEFKSNGGVIGSTTKQVGKVKITKKGGKKTLKSKRNKNPSQNAADDAKKIKQVIAKGGKLNWKSWLAWGAGIGIGAVALWWFFHDSDEDVPIPDDMPTEEPIDNSPSANSGGGTTYTPCTGTYTQNCKSEKIREVQRCLGMPPKYQTGNFGPITFGYLERQGKGFQTGFTDADVSKICKEEDTGGSQNQTQPVSPQVQYGTDTSTPSIVGGISGGDTGTQETEVDINDSTI